MTIDTNTMHFDDVIDVRDIIERIEELRDEREALADELTEAKAANAERPADWSALAEKAARLAHYDKTGEMELPIVQAVIDAKNALTEWESENAEELQTLQDLMDELKGNGGDEQWDGDWYPVTLIRESYFEEYMDEMIADCYEMPKNLPSFMTITLDYVALQMDYTSTEINGITYLYR